jgi:hypothetical protein
MTRRVMINPTPSPPLVTQGGLALSDSEKAEALTDSLGTQIKPVNNPTVPAVIEVFNEAMRAFSYAPASEPKQTTQRKLEPPFGVSKSARHQAQTEHWIGAWNIFR